MSGPRPRSSGRARNERGDPLVQAKLELHPGLRRVTGFDQRVLLAAIAEDRGDRSFGILTLFGYDLVWKLDDTDAGQVLTVMLAADW